MAHQIWYFVAVDRQIGSRSSRSSFGWRRISTVVASGVGSRLRLASASVVCVFMFRLFGGGWGLAVGSGLRVREAVGGG